jgi:transposase
LSGGKECVGRSVSDNRKFVEAVIWIRKNGGRWRCLPEEYWHEVASISADLTMKFKQWDFADNFP